jgi:type II secretory pathway pseudopilin PulG
MNNSMPATRWSFTIVETLVAMSVVAVGLMAVLSSIFTLDAARKSTVEDMRLNALMRTLVDRVQGAQWTDLGTTRLPWSRARLFEDHSARNGDDLPMTQADLLSYGLLTQPILSDGSTSTLKVYFEYYRAVAHKDASGERLPGQEGLAEQAAVTSVAAARGMLRSANNRARYRLNPTSDGLGIADPLLLGNDDPVLIRIVIELGPTRHLEIVTGRKL